MVGTRGLVIWPSLQKSYLLPSAPSTGKEETFAHERRSGCSNERSAGNKVSVMSESPVVNFPSVPGITLHREEE